MTRKRREPRTVFVFENLDLSKCELPEITIHFKDGQVTHLTADGPLNRMMEAARKKLRARSEIEAARDMKAKMEAAGAKLVRIWANGHDVTDQMPLTRAELEKQRPK